MKRDEKLAAKIIEEFHDAGQRGDVQAFKRLLESTARIYRRTLKMS